MAELIDKDWLRFFHTHLLSLHRFRERQGLAALFSGVARRLYISVFAALLTVTLDSPSGAQDQSGKDESNRHIKIGLIVSTSGVAADGGPDLVNGFKLYLDQVHNKMSGRQIDLIVENDESNRATALAKIKKLLEQDHVDVIAGLILSNIALVAAPISEKAHVPLLLPVTGADDLTMRNSSPWVIRLSFSSSQVSNPFGDWVRKNLKYKKVVTIGSDFPLAYESIGGFQRSFEDAGGQVIQKIYTPLGFKDFKDYIKQINPNADAVFVVTPVGAGEIFTQQLRAALPKMPMIGAGPTFDETVIRHVGDEVIGAVNPFIYSYTLNNPANKKFVSAYRTKFDQFPSHMSEGSYVCAMCIDKAVRAMHGNISNKDQFMAALRSADLKDAPRGPIKIDDRNNPTENVYIFKVERVNGRLANVPIYTYPQVSLFWKYDSGQILRQQPYSRTYPPISSASPNQ
jgi:branched-chain amino acid transport system substrate-binding protein